MPDDIVTDIYEAAFIPEKWDSVLAGLYKLSGAAAGGFLLYDGVRPVRARMHDALAEVMPNLVGGPGWQTSQIIQYFHKNPFTGFMSAADYLPPEMFDQDPTMQGPRYLGFDDMIGSFVPMPGGEMAIFFLNLRRDSTGDRHARQRRRRALKAMVGRANPLHPHLARSSLISARLGFRQAQASVAALEALGLPAAVLSGAGRIVTSNPLLDAASDVLLPTAFGGLAVAHPPADKLLREAIDRIGRRNDSGVQSIPVPALRGKPAMVLHVLPLRRAAHDIFSRAEILLAATTVSPSALVPSPTILMGLFDLTPAEVRLASTLVRGEPLKVAAHTSGITYSSARTYLERIFAKTGVHSQSELVALLASAHTLR